ncbi:MAG TPA: hypothetical protein VJU61_05845, partial [Polyangiaceae bacterium]|nr:hypothetical protein [Polyangiaceae bacterium]
MLLAMLLPTHGCSDANLGRDAVDTGASAASFDAGSSSEAGLAPASEAVPDSGFTPALEASV